MNIEHLNAVGEITEMIYIAANPDEQEKDEGMKL